MRKFIILLFVSIGLSQTTFTDQEIINLENDFIYLENMVDSLAFEDSLKTILVTTLEEELELTNEELKLTNEQLALTEKKVKEIKKEKVEVQRKKITVQKKKAAVKKAQKKKPVKKPSVTTAKNARASLKRRAKR